MNTAQKITWIMPFLILLMLLGLLWHELFYTSTSTLPSPLIGEPLPAFQLPLLYSPQKMLTEKDLSHQVSLLNVWATWCYACKIEAPMLLKIKTQYHIPIYSILYKDDPKEALLSLKKNGNPYVMIGLDRKGDTAIDLGVYGTPETFVISREGKIIYRHVGIINQTVWDSVLYPLIKKYSGES